MLNVILLWLLPKTHQFLAKNQLDSNSVLLINADYLVPNEY